MNSTALPVRFYRDPAEVVELNQLDALGCRICESAAIVLSRVFCVDVHNEKQKGVPYVGHRCRWFNLREGS